MKTIKYVNLIEISQVVIEIQGIANGKLAVPVNNTLDMCATQFSWLICEEYYNIISCMWQPATMHT